MKATLLITLAAAALPLMAQEAPEQQPKRPNAEAREQHRTEFLQKYDKNGDGKIDKEEDAAVRADRKKAMEDFKATFFHVSHGNQVCKVVRTPGKVKEIMQKYDTNGDGKLDAEERKAMVQAHRDGKKAENLEKWDTNKDGKLDDQERAARREQMKAEHEQRMIKRWDANKDGVLDDQERAAMEAHQAQNKANKEARENAFMQKYDTNGNGQIDPEEHKVILQDRKAAYEALCDTFMRPMPGFNPKKDGMMGGCPQDCKGGKHGKGPKPGDRKGKRKRDAE